MSKKGIEVMWKTVLGVLILVIVMIVIYLIMYKAYWEPLSQIAEREIGGVM